MANKIDHLDPVTKHIYLAVGVREFHPVDDIYKEIRTLRATNNSLRGFDMPVFAAGNASKGGGKFTPRYAIIRGGWKIVPEDVSHTLFVNGDMITDIEGHESADNAIDFTPLSSSSKVFVSYVPPTAEIIETGVSGLTEKESDKLMGVPTESELAAVHGSGSWEGATPCQVWGHTDRRLSSRDIDPEGTGEHLPSEGQVLNIDTILSAIKGLSFQSGEDSLRAIRQLVESIPASKPKARFQV